MHKGIAQRPKMNVGWNGRAEEDDGRPIRDPWCICRRWKVGKSLVSAEEGRVGREQKRRRRFGLDLRSVWGTEGALKCWQDRRSALGSELSRKGSGVKPLGSPVGNWNHWIWGRRGRLGLKEDLRKSQGGAFEFCPQKRGTRGGPSAQECSGVNNGRLGGQQGGRGVWGRTRGSIALSHIGCHTRVPNASSLLSPPDFGDHALSPLCFPPPSPLGDSRRELCGHSDPQMAFVTC